MVKTCCNCANTRKDAILYKFPVKKNRRVQWLRHLGLQPSRTRRFVCQKHFDKRFIGPRSRLHVNAYPSLFTASEISSGIPDSKNDNLKLHDNPRNRTHMDHSYCKNKPLPLESAAKCEISEPKVQTSTRKKVNKFIKLTPSAMIIYKEFKRAKSQTSFMRRAKRALKFSKLKPFNKLVQDLDPSARRFLAMQMKQRRKNISFSVKEKLVALEIMKQNPGRYRFLYRIFNLPSPTTLYNLVSQLDLGAGVNAKLFELIEKQVSTWKTEKKYCSIIFDEMALGMDVSDTGKEDNSNVFEHRTRRKQFACNILLFMLRGVINKWQQPVAYHICEGETSDEELKTIIRNVVEAVMRTGLKPIVLGCGQRTALRSAVRSLVEDTERSMTMQNEESDGTIVIGDSKLHIIYEPSHLIKGIRNNFLTKNISYNGKVSKWQDIVDVYKTDCSHGGPRFLNNLYDEHVIPDKIKKREAKTSLRVFSKKLASLLFYTAQFYDYADGTRLSDTMANTGEIVSFFDDVFNSLNGPRRKCPHTKRKALRSAVNERSKHHVFWPKAIEKLKKMGFVDDKGRRRSVPSIKNLVMTIKSHIRLWEFYKSLNVKVMRPRYFNIQPIDKFFRELQSYYYGNDNLNSCNALKKVLNFLFIFGSSSQWLIELPRGSLV